MDTENVTARKREYYTTEQQVAARFVDVISKIPDHTLNGHEIRNYALSFAQNVWRDRVAHSSRGVLTQSTAFDLATKISNTLEGTKKMGVLADDLLHLMGKNAQLVHKNGNEIAQKIHFITEMIFDLKNVLVASDQRHQIKDKNAAFRYLTISKFANLLGHSLASLSEHRRYATLVQKGQITHEGYERSARAAQSIAGMPQHLIKKRLADYDARQQSAKTGKTRVVVTPAPTRPPATGPEGFKAWRENRRKKLES